MKKIMLWVVAITMFSCNDGDNVTPSGERLIVGQKTVGSKNFSTLRGEVKGDFTITSDESWLLETSQQHGNMTYQEKIKSLPTLEEKLIFEMEHVGHYTIENMHRWNYQDSRFFEIKYEELIADESLHISVLGSTYFRRAKA